MIREQLRTCFQAGRAFEHRSHVVAVENVVPQNQADRTVLYELRPDHERLGDTLRLGLFLVAELHTQP